MISILLFITFSASANANPWQDLATQDLNAIHDIIATDHPGPVDKNNVEFKKWMEEGFLETKELIKKVDDLEGYRYALLHYVQRFNDGHLGFHPKYEPDMLGWPGFVMAYRAGKYVVYSLSTDKEFFPDLPSVGDEVTGCGGDSVDALLTKNIYSFSGDPVPSTNRYKQAAALFVDRGNPFVKIPENCTFKSAKKTYSLNLKWTEIPKGQIESLTAAAAFGKRPEFGFREFAPRKFWINLPSFDPHGSDLKIVHEHIEKLKAIRSRADLVVFDVRGNTGGNSEWGTSVYEAFFGKAALDFINHQISEKTYVDWRVSKRNLERVKSWPKIYSDPRGRLSQIANKIAQVMEESLKKGDALMRAPPIDGDDVISSAKSFEAVALNKKPVFFLTDGKCASACLDFADLMVATPTVVHAGLPTNADTVYMEINYEDLPSHLGVIFYPMKVYRNRPRGNNVGYTPRFAWDKDISDTAALRSWILGLAKTGRTN